MSKMARLIDADALKAKANADRIREMTEEEMVDFLDGVSADGCPCPARSCRSSCKECILDWLREPCGEDRYG